jgi:hypothetical protein
MQQGLERLHVAARRRVGADVDAAREVVRQVLAEERAHLQAERFIVGREFESHARVIPGDR